MGPVSEGLRPTRAIIDLQRIQANFRALEALLEPGAFHCPMVKANAYGHGDIAVAKALREAGAQHLGVALVEEGFKLRRGGDLGGILVFGVFFDARAAESMVEYNLTPVISEWEQVYRLDEALARDLPDAAVKLHLEFNTGMNRLGFRAADAPKLREWLNQQRWVKLEGVCTHLLRGEDLGQPESRSGAQLREFGRCLDAFRGLKFRAHALNSAAMVARARRASSAGSLISAEFGPLGGRPGISLYGVQAAPLEADLQIDVKPALSWVSRLVDLHVVEAGESVSYNGRWVAERPSLIGVLPVGYADGYVRQLSNRGSVLCRGRRAKVAGTVCMDYFMVDLTDVANELRALGQPDLRVGEDIVLLGEQWGTGENGVRLHASISAQELADLTETIPYEVCTRISERVPRYYGKAGR